MDEHHLLSLIIEGDHHAFKQLYDLYSPRVYGTSLNYTQDKQDAEEVTQDVFLKIHQNASNFKGNSSVSTWIYRITVNSSLNYLKKKKRTVIFELFKEGQHKPHFIHPGVQLEQQEHSNFLFMAMEKLPESQKTAFILCFVDNLPRAEAAEIMQIKLKALESLLQRAKSNMRTFLEKIYPERRK